MKVCTKCKIEKEVVYFYKDKSKKDGFRPRCKKCLNNSVEYNKQWRLDNKEKIKKYNKQYSLDNREQIYLRKNEYIKNRKLNDPLFKLTCSIRTLISTSINRNGYSKNSRTYEILGCSFEDFKIHLEQQFTEGMTWNNHGEWELDHIYPVSLAIDEQHIIKLNHYTNFQPLWWEDNNKKNNKI